MTDIIQNAIADKVTVILKSSTTVKESPEIDSDNFKQYMHELGASFCRLLELHSIKDAVVICCVNNFMMELMCEVFYGFIPVIYVKYDEWNEEIIFDKSLEGKQRLFIGWNDVDNGKNPFADWIAKGLITENDYLMHQGKVNKEFYIGKVKYINLFMTCDGYLYMKLMTCDSWHLISDEENTKATYANWVVKDLDNVYEAVKSCSCGVTEIPAYTITSIKTGEKY